MRFLIEEPNVFASFFDEVPSLGVVMMRYRLVLNLVIQWRRRRQHDPFSLNHFSAVGQELNRASQRPNERADQTIGID
jgi:hypothetical protein